MRILDLSTMICMLAGLLIWTGVFIVASGGTFFVWVIAKILYALGILLFIFDK